MIGVAMVNPESRWGLVVHQFIGISKFPTEKNKWDTFGL